MARVNKEQVLESIGYDASQNYHSTNDQHHPLTAHLYRSAGQAGADGVYLFHTSHDDEMLPARAAVFVAEADTPEQARVIHRSLWNLGNAPFIIVILPGQIRVYTGFDYDRTDEQRGLIKPINVFNPLDIRESLADYSADAIDSGRIWASQSRHLKPETRLDAHLLKNLQKLEFVLVDNGLDRAAAHALIGKYVYIRYLWDREILSEQWLSENRIDIDSVLGRGATLKGLRKLTETLDELFNGHIFPFPLTGEKAPTDDQIAIAASAFKGDDPVSGQMPLFDLYDFSYIPIETLSSIYEQFLHSQGKGKKVGAVYTPEHLADYLLAELNHAKPLKKGMTVLDPCCGSGIFLVLAYRKLIETELLKRPDLRLRPTELRQILTESIFGVERSREACYVAELSLILTMLHYISPPDLHRNKRFKFPVLHNQQIFEADFFDDASQFWNQREHFDWVIGNPPWIEPESDDKEEHHVLAWINSSANRQERPVAGNRVAEAFSWRVMDLLKNHGCIGLLLNATSLFNHESQKFRQEFFRQHDVLRITNFTNLRYLLFHGRGKAPPATTIYGKTHQNHEKPAIIHYGPLVINHFLSEAWDEFGQKETWVLTINENEISSVPADEGETGDAVTWKLALWGGPRDKRALQRLRRLFPGTLREMSRERGWHLHQGVELREAPVPGAKTKYEVEPAPGLKGQKFFDAEAMVRSGYRFHIPEEAMKPIPVNQHYLRKRGGERSLKEIGASHVLFNVGYSVYTDEDFVLRAPDKRLSAPATDADALRALSVFFSSSLIRYYLFFHSPAWGVDRNRIYKRDIQQVPVPELSAEQIRVLAELQRDVAAKEASAQRSSDELQDILDEGVERILNVTKNACIVAKDFVRVRLSLVHGKVSGVATKSPNKNELLRYGHLLRGQLDQFTKGRVRHRVSVVTAADQGMIVCEVEVIQATSPLEVIVDRVSSELKASLGRLYGTLKQQFSQWVYVQRGLRIFDGPRVYICKPNRLIDWTRSEALNDADDLIADVLSRRNGDREVAANGAR
jgi:methylase of polypeptide subunit release factors